MQRFTEDQLLGVYAATSSYRGLPGGPRRHAMWGIPITLAILALVLHLAALFWLMALAAVPGIWAYLWPGVVNENQRRLLKRYEAAIQEWAAICDATAPSTKIVVPLPLHPDEVVYFYGPAQRLAERQLGQRIVSKSSGRIGSALVGAAIAGPAGAIVGSAGSKKTVGTATNIYGIAPLDAGDLVVTNERFVFLGQRDTIDVPMASIFRFSTASEFPRYEVTPEYGGREPGERYVVDRDLFLMNMARRSELGFIAPAPPEPIPLTAMFTAPYITPALPSVQA